jgi:DNA-binding transcriptional MerR regulator
MIMGESERKDNSLETFHAGPESGYTLETVVHLTGVSRRSILVYIKSGLVPAQGDPENESFTFDEDGIYRIRRIEHLRSEQGINLAGIQVIFELLNQIEHLRSEMRFRG